MIQTFELGLTPPPNPVLFHANPRDPRGRGGALRRKLGLEVRRGPRGFPIVATAFVSESHTSAQGQMLFHDLSLLGSPCPRLELPLKQGSLVIQSFLALTSCDLLVRSGIFRCVCTGSLMLWAQVCCNENLYSLKPLRLA